MYNREEERLKILSILHEVSQTEVPYTKELNFQRAISLALDEVHEIEQRYNQFIADVSHLEVFHDALKEPLTQDAGQRFNNLKYLIEKNYTQEEKSNMPQDVLNQIRSTQERRIQLLKKVAKRYLSRPKQS